MSDLFLSGLSTFDYKNRTLSITIELSFGRRRGGGESTHTFRHNPNSEIIWHIDADSSNNLLRIQPSDESVNKRFKYELSIDVDKKRIYGPCVYNGTTFQCGMPEATSILFGLFNQIRIKIVYPYEAIIFCSCSLQKPFPEVIESGSPLRRMLTRATSREEFADVQFIAEDNLIVAHKHILADRSEVFRKMFLWNADHPIGTSEPIRLVDVSYAGFDTFLNAIYFGTVPSDPEMCVEVVMLADKYDISDIKTAVETSAIESLNSDNVISMLIISHLHKADHIKKVALEFCAKKPMQEIRDVEDLAKYPGLMVEVLKHTQELKLKA